ncbi:MAG: hypothetical protein K2P93_02545 [Alphaproteobacteria bacterium]|nr:hypothetical protein [Alphaproteobacteria bacterium]
MQSQLLSEEEATTIFHRVELITMRLAIPIEDFIITVYYAVEDLEKWAKMIAETIEYAKFIGL